MNERFKSPGSVAVPASSFIRAYVTAFEIAFRREEETRLQNMCHQIENAGLHDSLHCSSDGWIVLWVNVLIKFVCTQYSL